MLNDQVSESLTFDDLLLVPAESNILPKDVDTSTYLTKNIRMRIPDHQRSHGYLTESRTAIALADLASFTGT
jgi:IMP dehydrogenase